MSARVGAGPTLFFSARSIMDSSFCTVSPAAVQNLYSTAEIDFVGTSQASSARGSNEKERECRGCSRYYLCTWAECKMRNPGRFEMRRMMVGAMALVSSALVCSVFSQVLSLLSHY